MGYLLWPSFLGGYGKALLSQYFLSFFSAPFCRIVILSQKSKSVVHKFMFIKLWLWVFFMALVKLNTVSCLHSIAQSYSWYSIYSLLCPKNVCPIVQLMREEDRDQRTILRAVTSSGSRKRNTKCSISAQWIKFQPASLDGRLCLGTDVFWGEVEWGCFMYVSRLICKSKRQFSHSMSTHWFQGFRPEALQCKCELFCRVYILKSTIVITLYLINWRSCT